MPAARPSTTNPSVAMLAGGVLLTLAVGFLYGHTLQVPFYLDDHTALEQNFLLRDLPAAFLNVFSPRGLTYLSFALNYRLGGLSLPLLHLTNIVLHAGCGVLVWLVLRQLLPGRPWLPLAGALLFVAHPLQTQAVTYLVQRATVLATLFYLGAFLLHLRCRQLLVDGHSPKSPRYLRCWLGALFAGGCAVLAKENAATLPLLLLSYDRLFPPAETPGWRQMLFTYGPFCLVPLLIGGLTLKAVASPPSETVVLAAMEGNAPLTYLVTQFSVFWVYLRLLMLPYGQALEHNYPVVCQLATLQNVFALIGLLGVIGLAWRVRHRRPLLAFGAAWFFLGLAVESSLIPLDPLFEHRLYLPMTGFLLVLTDGLSAMLNGRRTLAVLGLALLVCLPLTWRRNALWTDPIALYEDNLRQVPGSERAMETLAVHYAEAGDYVKEASILAEGRRLYPRNPVLIVNQARALAEERKLSDALTLIDVGLRMTPEHLDYYLTLPLIFPPGEGKGLAIDRLQQHLPRVPVLYRARLYNALGELYLERGETELAERAFRDGLVLHPRDPVLLANLGRVMFSRQHWSDTLDLLRRSLVFGPGNPNTLEGLALVAAHLGDQETQRLALAKLRHADIQVWRRLRRELPEVGEEGGR